MRIQVNVRDNSVSSNEGTGTLNNIGKPSTEASTRLKTGFNVSYDSNSFQGIKNNLIL